MRKSIVLAAVLSTAAASPASAKDLSTSVLKDRYTALRHAVISKHGKRTAGRNIRAQGVRSPRGKAVTAKPRHYATSIRTYRRWLAPPVPVAAATDNVPVGSIASAPAKAGGKWAIPAYIVMRESGGSYSARNPSGAFGAYQLMPMHFQSGGACAGMGTHPAGQDQCAAKLWATQGSAPWAATR